MREIPIGTRQWLEEALGQVEAAGAQNASLGRLADTLREVLIAFPRYSDAAQARRAGADLRLRLLGSLLGWPGWTDAERDGAADLARAVLVLACTLEGKHTVATRVRLGTARVGLVAEIAAAAQAEADAEDRAHTAKCVALVMGAPA